MATGRCLCGGVTFELLGKVPPMFHCHCSRCRKAHGAAFATYVAVPEAAVRLTGAPLVAQFQGEVGDVRAFCRLCGSVVPYAVRGTMFVPAGNFDGDPGARPARHTFVDSCATWYEIADQLPRFASFAPELSPGAAAVPARAPLDPLGADRARGSCLCGAVTYLLADGPLRRRYCHCGRCRKGLSAAHAANLTTSHDGVRFTRGEDLLVSFKVPDAQYFTQVFCHTCGSPVARRDPGRGIAVVPMGGLDDDPGVRPTSHIFVGSKAPWFEIADQLPKYPEYPPAS